MFGIFGKKKPQGKPWLEKGGYPKPTKLPGSAKKWQPPVKPPPEPATPAAKTGDPES